MIFGNHSSLLVTGTTLLVALLIPSIASSRNQPSSDETSPVRRIEPRTEHDQPAREPAGGVASIDGSGNNPFDSEMNAAVSPLARMMPDDYADGVDAMSGDDRPSARLVSNVMCHQGALIDNPLGTSDFLWQWGQFLDHDIDLTDGTSPPELAPIVVPAGDPWFDPDASGDEVMIFNRSLYDVSGDAGARQQLNEITGWIDASNVYGSDTERAEALRTLDGTGRLRTSAGDLLPNDDSGLPNATGGSSQLMFLAGDVRANEQVALTAMHTLFVREHNRVADDLRGRHPEARGDEVYERARAHVAALVQSITFREFLPALLGQGAVAPYRGYDSSIDARIANSFSTAVYRFGHSALSPTLLRLDRNLEEIEAGSLALRDAFFSPNRLRDEGGIDPILRGLAHQRHQRIDSHIIDDVRNFLFGLPGEGGFDLAALNVQRGRDHGLPSYAYVREAYGFGPLRTLADVSGNAALQQRLAETYVDASQIDLWVGGLSEDPLPGSHLGPLFTAMLIEQFEALRDGDRFWYERALRPEHVDEIERTRLSDVIRRNTAIGREIPDDVFRIVEQGRQRPPRR